METKTVKHWNARLELPTNNSTIEIVTEDLNVMKETVQLFTKGGARFEPYGSSGTTLIFHPSVDQGRKACGWINSFEVPQYLSNQTLIERRELQAA
jgi:hypothetical protein